MLQELRKVFPRLLSDALHSAPNDAIVCCQQYLKRRRKKLNQVFERHGNLRIALAIGEEHDFFS